MVICLERGADFHMAQLMPLPLTVSCFSEIQIGFTFLVLAHLGSPGKRAVKQMCVCVCVSLKTEIMQQILTFLWWSAGHFPAQCSIKKHLWHIILFIKYVTKRVLNFRNGGQRRFRLHFLLLLIMINISHSLACLLYTSPSPRDS